MVNVHRSPLIANRSPLIAHLFHLPSYILHHMSHHHHHRKDSATLFKERSLNAIGLRRKLEKWLKVALMVLALLMILVVIFVYTMG